MFKLIAIASAVVIAAILVIAGMRRDTFRVERSARIAAPAEKIFRYVNDFHQWGVWSLYEKLDCFSVTPTTTSGRAGATGTPTVAFF